jgi:uncharacterized protein (DUF983 family)
LVRCSVAAPGRRVVNFGFAISLVLVGFAIVGVFIEIPFVSNYAFWVAIGAYVILAATQSD